MWYFSWILGLGLALTFGVLNAMWFEIREDQVLQGKAKQGPPDADPGRQP